MQTRPLREIITLEKGKPPARVNHDGPGAECYLTPDYLRGKAEAGRIKPGKNAVHVRNGDTIVLWDGSNAGEIFRARDGILASTMMRVRHHADYRRDYFYYALKSWEDYLKGQTSGSGIPHVDKDIIGNLSLFNCNKLEQSKIAQVLSSVDRAIEQTEGLIAKQQHIKTGMMQDLLTRGVDEHGNLRSEDTHKFKDSPLGRIPVEWECVKLRTRLKSIEQGWSPDCDTTTTAQGQWGVLKTTSVVWSGYQDKENKALPGNLKPRPHYEVKQGDVLMTRGGPNSRVGVVAYVCSTQSKLMLSDKLYRLVPDDSTVPEFLALALSASKTQRHLSTLKTGLAESQTNISQKIVKQLDVTLPSKEEQQRIADTLRNCSDQAYVSQSQLHKLRSLKTGLMQDLLTGKVRVTPLLENAATGS